MSFWNKGNVVFFLQNLFHLLATQTVSWIYFSHLSKPAMILIVV